MKGILLTSIFIFFFQLCHAQFEEGRLITLAFGTGVSDHAGSYTIREDFRTKQFSGFRALIIEARLGWNFWETTNIYGMARISPSNSTISPYRSFNYGIGVAQAIPFFNRLYFMGDYGKYSSSLGDGIRAGSGNMYTLGIGLRIDDNLFFEGNVMRGNLSEIDSEIDIQSKEKKLFAKVSYSF